MDSLQHNIRRKNQMQFMQQKIEEVWARASLPFITHKRIIKLILAYNKKYQNIIKPIKSRVSGSLHGKINAFKDNSKYYLIFLHVSVYLLPNVAVKNHGRFRHSSGLL